MANAIDGSAVEAAALPHLRSCIDDNAGQGLLREISTTMVSTLASVNVGRRSVKRSTLLLGRNRAAVQPSAGLIGKSVSAWATALPLLRNFAALLTPESIGELDALVAQVDDPTKVAGDVLRTTLVEGMGFSPAEHDWCIDQLQRAGYRMLFALSDGDPAVLKALVEAGTSGDSGLLQIGFVTLSTSRSANELIEACVRRARISDITASLFHLLPPMILAAAHVGHSTLPLPTLWVRMQRSRDDFILGAMN